MRTIDKKHTMKIIIASTGMIILFLVGLLHISSLNSESDRLLQDYNKIVRESKESGKKDYFELITLSNKRLYQHFVAEVFVQNKVEMTDRNIILFLKLSECDSQDVNFCTAKYETGNGSAGSGMKYFEYAGNRYLSNGHHGMKIANSFFHWNEKLTIRNKQSYLHWTYSYLTFDERLQKYKTWVNWKVHKQYYNNISRDIIVPKSREDKYDYLITLKRK